MTGWSNQFIYLFPGESYLYDQYTKSIPITVSL